MAGLDRALFGVCPGGFARGRGDGQGTAGCGGRQPSFWADGVFGLSASIDVRRVCKAEGCPKASLGFAAIARIAEIVGEGPLNFGGFGRGVDAKADLRRSIW